MKRLLKNSIYIVVIFAVLILAFLVYGGSPREAPVFEDSLDPFELETEGSGLGANHIKIGWLADYWNNQERGFTVSGSYGIDPMTWNGFVKWHIKFTRVEELDVFSTQVAFREFISNRNEQIIGEIIAATIEKIEPGSISIYEHNWITIEGGGLYRNPSFWVVGYELKKRCLDKVARARDYAVWVECAIEKDGEINLVDKGRIKLP